MNMRTYWTGGRSRKRRCFGSHRIRALKFLEWLHNPILLIRSVCPQKVFATQPFVLGGGVTKAGASFWEVVRRVARETALPEVHFDIVPAALGDEAPLWGAVALANDLAFMN